MSLRARLLAAALVLVVLGLGAADVATYSALRRFLVDRIDAQLEGAAQNVQRALFSPNGVFAEASLRQLGTVVPGVYVQVRDNNGDPVVTVEGRASNEPPSSPRLPGRAGTATTRSAEPDGPDYRVRVSSLFPNNTLIVALPLRDTADTLHRLLIIELVVSAAVIAAVAGVGLWLVRLGLRPLADIEAASAKIAAGDMSQRLGRDDDRTEVGRLGRALNLMLDQINEAFAERRASEEAARASERRVRQFVADASHELRTPVAAVRAYAELYRLGADENPADLARLLSRIEEEAARIGVLVDDLLLLTRLDEGRPLELAPVDLGALASDAVEAAKALEPERPIDLSVVGSVEVQGDRDRLRQVVDNLLANVRSHTPPGVAADVRVAANNGHAFVEVADRGPGVPTEDAARVFERFYRADPARSRDGGGAGLGLSIVAAIATAHGGAATAAARPGGGAVFRVELPLLADND